VHNGRKYFIPVQCTDILPENGERQRNRRLNPVRRN
jgi:hypothetical protein